MEMRHANCGTTNIDCSKKAGDWLGTSGWENRTETNTVGPLKWGTNPENNDNKAAAGLNWNWMSNLVQVIVPFILSPSILTENMDVMEVSLMEGLLQTSTLARVVSPGIFGSLSPREIDAKLGAVDTVTKKRQNGYGPFSTRCWDGHVKGRCLKK